MNLDSSISINLNYSANFNKVITLGPKGTFSNGAANLVAGNRIKKIAYTTTLPEIILEVEKDPNALGVIPIENSTSGIVGQAQDSLVSSGVIIINEIRLNVNYSLVSNVPLEKVEQYFCHSVAFNQTMVYTSQQLKQADVVYSNSNIHSGDILIERSEHPVAAIIPKPAARNNERYHGKIIIDDIQDYDPNITRFVIVQKKPENHFHDFTKEKTSVFVEAHEDRHSILFEILREFHVYGINICRLESRPSKNTPWSYGFFIDFYNNHRSATCLTDIQNLGISCEILGVYNFISKAL
ncbi:MAG: hypothetical protein GY786_03470 [Proteobacteria bacterium]|nr:hypothetical protein [Pseudomonadota bacterium]